MSLLVFFLLFSVLSPYWTARFFPSSSTRKYQYHSGGKKAPFHVALLLSFLAANVSRATRLVLLHHGRISFSVAHDPALSVPQKFGYNKKSKNVVKKSNKAKKAAITGTDGYATRPSVPRQSESTPIPIVPKRKK